MDDLTKENSHTYFNNMKENIIKNNNPKTISILNDEKGFIKMILHLYQIKSEVQQNKQKIFH